jgi:predicted transglutaminase-like cysteine proteinase
MDKILAILSVGLMLTVGGGGIVRAGPLEDGVIDEPFGLATVIAPDDAFGVKWRQLQSEVRSDERIITQCRAEPNICASPAAPRFLAIVNEARQYKGLTRIGHINRAINLAIRPMDNAAERGNDEWKSPLAALASGVGNCTAYAITKYAALRDAGIVADELRLIIVPIKSRRGTHMVVAVRNFGHWIILDNRSMALVESSELHDYLPLFTLDHRGVRQFVQPTNPKVAGAPCTGACS